MGPTLTLISLENGRRIAAYAQSSWDGNAGWIRGYNNVLYSFNAKKYRISKTKARYGQFSKEAYGPYFGYQGNEDFAIGTDMTNVARCNTNAFSGPATPVDVCGDLGGGAWRLPGPTLGVGISTAPIYPHTRLL